MNFSLSLPRLVFGAGAVADLSRELTALGIRKPLLLSDAVLERLGHVGRVAAILAKGQRCEVFAEVPENPTFAGVEAAAARFRKAGCDAVVALGGGSVIDTAKLVAVIGGQGGAPGDYVAHSDRVTAATAPVVVIPTTAGTGSDASPDAGIHPDARSISSGITSRHVVPRLALCDPELTLSMPAGLTAATGLDAISHCVEGYLASTVNPLADVLALDGFGRAWRWIGKATATPDDLEARGQMMIAAFEGGVAIGKGLGPAHAIAISCGDQGLHHGKLSALGVLAMMQTMQAKLPQKVKALGAAAGLAEPLELGRALRELMRRLGLPLTLADLGYRVGSIDKLAQACSQSHFNATAGYVPGPAEYREMLLTIAA